AEDLDSICGLLSFCGYFSISILSRSTIHIIIMRFQIVIILLVAAFCCEATYLPGTFGLGGASYATLGLGYPANPVAPFNVAPYNSYASAAIPGNVKVTYVAPSDLGNYVVLNDVAAPAAAASYTVVEPAHANKETASRYVAPLRSYGNIAYVVKK
ncbi:unnamed protein product, partial [Larinioides sclopetarius]